MSKTVRRILKVWIVSTFAAGLFVLLPMIVTLALMGWLATKVVGLLGPGSVIGEALRSIGVQIVRDEGSQVAALVVGWAAVIVLIWLLGVIVRHTAKNKVQGLVDGAIRRIPFLKSVYGPVAQVVGMLKSKEEPEMAGMPVVFCAFGPQHGGGLLGLLASSKKFKFGERECHVVYVPTSPVPMSGGILFVPVELVQLVDMSVDDLMKIYFSLGVLSAEAVPQRYQRDKDDHVTG